MSPVRGKRILPTVKLEARGLAEAALLKMLEENAGRDAFLARVVAELDEAEALREALSALDDSRVAFLHD